MLPLEKQRSLVAQYASIPDVHERLNLLLERARKRAPLDASAKTEANRVPGCTSRVWLRGRVEEGRCHFEVDADSVLVRGLAAAVCEVYEGATLREVIAVETQVLEELGIAESLSPTRRHGLQQVRWALRDFASRAEQALGVPA